MSTDVPTAQWPGPARPPRARPRVACPELGASLLASPLGSASFLSSSSADARASPPRSWRVASTEKSRGEAASRSGLASAPLRTDEPGPGTCQSGLECRLVAVAVRVAEPPCLVTCESEPRAPARTFVTPVPGPSRSGRYNYDSNTDMRKILFSLTFLTRQLTRVAVQYYNLFKGEFKAPQLYGHVENALMNLQTDARAASSHGD